MVMQYGNRLTVSLYKIYKKKRLFDHLKKKQLFLEHF